MIDYNALREELRDECFAAYYGGGIGPALMDALSVDDMSPDELIKTAQLWGIDIGANGRFQRPFAAEDDALVIVFDEELLPFAPVFHDFLCQIIADKAFLHEKITCILLIPKYSGVDTMCAVGANRCIVGASMGAY